MHSISLVAICEPKTPLANMDMIRVKMGMDFAVANQWGSVWVFYKSFFDGHMVGELDKHLTLSLSYQLWRRRYIFLLSMLSVQ